MFIANRILAGLGIIGAVVGMFFAVQGALKAHNAVQSVKRDGGDADSLFRADKFDSALDKVRARVGEDGKLLGLNVYPGYMMAEATDGSEGRAFRVQFNGHVAKVPFASAGLGDAAIPLSRLDGKTVQKVAEAVAGKDGATLDDISHIILTKQPATGKAGWSVYVGDSKHWLASLDGSDVSNPADAALATAAKGQTAAEAAAEPAAGVAKTADDLAACMQRAGTDIAKIQACSG
jgi:hypothetical protein